MYQNEKFSKLFFCLIVVFCTLVFNAPSYAQLSDGSYDAYDPFADYSEFDEASQEEADIHFFKNGRFFTIGFLGGARLFTNYLGSIYKESFAFGGQLSYFFDLRFALQVSFITGNHQFTVPLNATSSLTGNANIQQTAVALKYYLNTQNVTRGLANLNPYLIAGVSQIYRVQTFDNTDGGFGKDSAFGAHGGIGLEIPLMRNKMYFGFEATYEYVAFKDENIELKPPDPADPNLVISTGIFPKGDALRLMGSLGINF